MRSQVAVPVVCAVLGGAVTAGGLVLAGLTAAPATRTVVQQEPLLASSPVGATAAGQVYQRDASGVVAIEARTVVAPPTAFDSPGRRTGRVSGAAVVVGDGTLLTAAHLVRAASQIEVDCGGRRASATVAALDMTSDLAVLRVRPDGLGVSPLPLGDSDTVRVGDAAVALGREPGAAPALSAGVIAARQSSLQGVGGGRLDDALQLDAELGPADVGGPLVDAAGYVIGITTRMRTAGGADATDLAVPVNTARGVLSSLDDPAAKVVGG